VDWPLNNFTITRGFNYKSSLYVGGQHAAIDLAAPLGTPIKAVESGIVYGDAYDPYSGYFIGLQHPNGWLSWYRHLRADAPPVKGQQIVRGQIIGYVGSTGASMGPHLHFDLWHSSKQDPTAFFKNGWWAHDPELYLGKEDSIDMAIVLAKPNYGGRWVLVGAKKQPLTAAAFKALNMAKQVTLITMTETEINQIPTLL